VDVGELAVSSRVLVFISGLMSLMMLLIRNVMFIKLLLVVPVLLIILVVNLPSICEKCLLVEKFDFYIN
jgi:hypothetical protein